MRKMIHVATVSHAALQALARETGRSFQDLIDEGIADLLKKHKRPITLKEMLRDSLATGDKATKVKATKAKPKRRTT
ncbi:MAG TPA: ribbon-helix-helix domain-containing protein [Reyranella sp.]|nr:ribbon-helix-helix domain-containing protein [Reyranella sp.]